MSKVLTLVACAALAGVLVLTSVAAAKPTEQVSFTIKYLSKDKKRNTGIASLRTQFSISDDAGAAQPSPVNRILLRFPKGAVTNSRAYPTCDKQKILDTVGKGCPSKSVLGKGSATALARPIVPDPVNAAVTLFNGKGGGGSQSILILAVPSLGPNLVLEGQLKKVGGNYGYVLENKLDPIQTLPGAPDASVTSFDATVGPKPIKKGKRKIGYITAPLICNGTFFLLDGLFGYADGTQNTVYEKFTLTGGPRCP